MASIKLISPQLQNNLSQPATRLVIAANKQALFHIPEWASQEEFVGLPQKLTLLLKDKANKTVLKTVNGTTASPLGILIEKKYAGSYSFVLEASIDGSTEKATTTISAYSAPKIVTANWSKQKDTADQSEINYGHTLYINLATEGLNGDNLTLELYNKKDEKKAIDTVTQLCTNGDAEFEVNTLKYFGSTREIQEVEDFFVQVKSPDGQYITAGSDAKVTNFSIKNKTVIAQTEKPNNKTPLKIGKPDKAPLPTGAISLEKILVDTRHDVCNDEIKDYNDFKNFWILENNGKYYHWLKKSLIGLKEADDKTKPTPLPITIASNEKFILDATFKTIVPLDKAEIRVLNKNGKYEFPTLPAIKTKKDEEFVIKFESNNKDPYPYENKTKYIPNFELTFEYSLDKKTWIPLGSATFCFYLTWKIPLFSQFDESGNPITSMQVKNNLFEKKANILESLLWISCNQSKETKEQEKSGKSEEEILDGIFEKFTPKKIIRRREGEKRGDKDYFLSVKLKVEGLGYWRRTSSAKPSAEFNNLRSLRYLFNYGEARCGEFTTFLKHLAYTQGIQNVEDFAIVTKAISISYFPLISKTTPKGIEYYIRQYDYQSQLDSKGQVPFQNQQVTAAAVQDAALIKGELVPVGLTVSPSGTQSIKKAPFNVIPYNGSDKKFVTYDEYVDAIFLVKSWKVKEPDPPVELSASAQGNTNPLNFFWDHVFMMYNKGIDKKYFDPSYGSKSADKKYYKDKTTLLADYTIASLTAVVGASVPKKGDGKPFFDKKHTQQYVDLFKNAFESSSTKVQSFKYKYYTTQMEKHLLIQ
jgi:hypothetical protein